MTYYYDEFGWLTRQKDSRRSTESPPPERPWPDGEWPNWDERQWNLIPHRAHQIQKERIIKALAEERDRRIREALGSVTSTEEVIVKLIRVIDLLIKNEVASLSQAERDVLTQFHSVAGTLADINTAFSNARNFVLATTDLETLRNADIETDPNWP